MGRGRRQLPEVVGLYDNEEAAKAHASDAKSDVGLQVTRWFVASNYEPETGP